MCGGETDELQEVHVVDGTTATAIEAVEHLHQNIDTHTKRLVNLSAETIYLTDFDALLELLTTNNNNNQHKIQLLL